MLYQHTGLIRTRDLKSVVSASSKFINQDRTIVKVLSMHSRTCTHTSLNDIIINYVIIIGCAYKKGICAMCGKRIIDVSSYRQSTT